MDISTLILCLTWIHAVSALMKLQEIFSWNVLDWLYPDEITRNRAIQVESLIPENAIPIGIEKWKDKLFITVPRWIGGIPATLNYISLADPYEPSPKLIAYPSFEGNELGNCDSGLNTVYRIKVDKCDRLWVLDVGTFGYEPNLTSLCPCTLNVYDLNSDEKIRKYIFEHDVITQPSLITNIALDIGVSCADAYAYFSDEHGYGLIVYSWEKNTSWRFTHSYFMPDPLQGNYNISGLAFHWGNKGISGIAVSPLDENGFRTLFFSPLSSYTEFAISTRILRNASTTKNSFADFEVVGIRGPGGHVTAKVMDDCGVQLINLIDQNAIGCWSAFSSYIPENVGIVDKDDINLIFPCDIKIDEDKNVWVISNRMPLFIESVLDYSDINFRIFTAPLNTLVEGTICEPPVQVFPNTPLVRSNTRMLSYDETKPKGLIIPYPTRRPQNPAGIHNPRSYNSSNILNFSIIVSSKTLHYVDDVLSDRNNLNKVETTPKMIIYVNSPDYDEMTLNKQRQNMDKANVSLEMKKRVKLPTAHLNLYHTKLNDVPLFHKPDGSLLLQNNKDPNSVNLNQNSIKPTPFILYSKSRLEMQSSIKPYIQPKINKKKIFAPELRNSKQIKKIQNSAPADYVNFVSPHKNTLTKNSKAPYRMMERIDSTTTTTTSDEPVYNDDDYHNTSVVNIAPTEMNYGHELWFVRNASHKFKHFHMYTDQPNIEENSESQPLTTTDEISNDIVTDQTKKKQKNLNNQIPTKRSKQNQQKHFKFLDHQLKQRKPGAEGINQKKVIEHVSSPNAFPKRVNFINTAYVPEDSFKTLHFKTVRSGSPISKRITNTANLHHTNMASMNIKYIMRSDASSNPNYNVKVNVLYPTTITNSQKYPKENDRPDVGMAEIFTSQN